MKVKYIFVCLFVFCLFGLISCGGSGNKQERVKLTVWHVWGGGSQAETLAASVDKIKKENPDIDIEATAYEPDAFQVQTLKTAVAANDFADISYSWAGTQIQPFVEAGRLLPLDKYLTPEYKEQNFLPGVLDGMTFDGKVYGVPQVVQPAVMIYNKDLFQKYNLAIPETYDQLVSVIKTFRSNGVTPFCLGGQVQWTTMMYYDMIVVRYLGAEACAKALDGREPYDSDDFLKATQIFADLVEMGAFDPSAVSLNRYEAEMEFKMGRIPMIVEGSWVIRDFIADDSAVKNSMDVRGFPVIAGGKGATDILGGTNNQLIVNASTRYPDEAFLVAAALIRDNAIESFLNNEAISSWKLPPGVDTSNVNPALVQVADMIGKSTSSILYWDNVFPSDLTLTHEELIDKLLTKAITPQEFVKQQQTAINTYYKK